MTWGDGIEEGEEGKGKECERGRGEEGEEEVLAHGRADGPIEGRTRKTRK